MLRNKFKILATVNENSSDSENNFHDNSQIVSKETNKSDKSDKFTLYLKDEQSLKKKKRKKQKNKKSKGTLIYHTGGIPIFKHNIDKKSIDDKFNPINNLTKIDKPDRDDTSENNLENGWTVYSKRTNKNKVSNKKNKSFSKNKPRYWKPPNDWPYEYRKARICYFWLAKDMTCRNGSSCHMKHYLPKNLQEFPEYCQSTLNQD